MIRSNTRARVEIGPMRLHHWVAYGFGSGFSRWAPGTAGTLMAVPLYLILRPLPLPLYLAVLALLVVIGIWACGKTERELGTPDSSAIVWDEILGYLVTMAGAPKGWVWLLAGFVLFRVLDIFKPWPICALERRVTGGLGVVLDDLLAGLMALAVLQGAARLLL